MKKDPKLHGGHFERVRKAILKADGPIEPALILEGVLQNCLQRADTNELAKAILHKYGTLYRACRDTVPKDLTEISGIGGNTADRLAVMLHSMYLFSQNYGQNAIPTESSNYYNIIKLLDDYFVGKDTERAVIFLLNKQNYITFHKLLSYGDENHVVINKYDVLDLARRFQAAKVVLAHNHTNGSLFPSVEDFIMTKEIFKLLKDDNIILFDHIIYAKSGYFSFANSLIMDAIARRLENPDFNPTWD